MKSEGAAGGPQCITAITNAPTNAAKSSARKVKRKASEAEVDESMLGEELHAQPDDDDEEKVHGPTERPMAADAC